MLQAYLPQPLRRMPLYSGVPSQAMTSEFFSRSHTGLQRCISSPPAAAAPRQARPRPSGARRPASAVPPPAWWARTWRTAPAGPAAGPAASPRPLPAPGTPSAQRQQSSCQYQSSASWFSSAVVRRRCMILKWTESTLRQWRGCACLARQRQSCPATKKGLRCACEKTWTMAGTDDVACIKRSSEHASYLFA